MFFSHLVITFASKIRIVSLKFTHPVQIMALNMNKNLKLYYSIKEVAEMFGVNESTLRYWEQEFPY